MMVSIPGLYTCVARTSINTASETGQLTVKGVKPELVPVEEKYRMVLEGDRLSLPCKLKDGVVPAPSVIWYRNGEEVEQSRVREEEDNMLDSAMAQLENGVLLMSAIRAGGDCSARLACRLGQMTRQNSESADMILDAVEFLAPTISGSSRYTNFTSSFSAAVRAEDLSACSAQCSRCLVI